MLCVVKVRWLLCVVCCSLCVVRYVMFVYCLLLVVYWLFDVCNVVFGAC